MVDWERRQGHRRDRLWQERARRVGTIGIRRSIPTGRGPGPNRSVQGRVAVHVRSERILQADAFRHEVVDIGQVKAMSDVMM